MTLLTVAMAAPQPRRHLRYAERTDTREGIMQGRGRLVVAVAFLLAVAACGGEDDAAAPSSEQDASATTFPSSVGDLPGVSGGCEALANLSLAISSVVSGNFTGVPSDVVGNLPEEARADGQTLVDAIEEFHERLEQAGIDISQGLNLDEEQLDEYVDINAEVFNDDVDAAVNRLGVTMAGECAPGS
ncbi:MAG TPA: hypothetical protein VLG28_01020 [Acidimicrobiia bacterium]|nr:hypothetical protein [Acidimicrobiia bacterium]